MVKGIFLISWSGAVVARKAHNLEVGGSIPSSATNKSMARESKQIMAITSETLAELIQAINERGISKTDIVSLTQDNRDPYNWVVIYYN